MKKSFYLRIMAVVLCGVWIIPSALAVDGVYVGAEVGQVGLTGNTSTAFNNALGFGGDLGVRVNPFLDVVARGLYSSHSSALNGPKLSLTSGTVSADFRLLQLYDFEFALGAGPGFYFFNNGTTASKFGLNYGGNVDAVISDSFHIGVGARYHQVFSADDFWTVTMRVGFLFGAG